MKGGEWTAKRHLLIQLRWKCVVEGIWEGIPTAHPSGKRHEWGPSLPFPSWREMIASEETGGGREEHLVEVSGNGTFPG